MSLSRKEQLPMLNRAFVPPLIFALVLATSIGGVAQPATPEDIDSATEGHLAWVLFLFDGGAASITEADVEARFDPAFLRVVPAVEFIAAIQELAGMFGPLDLLEDQSTTPGEFVGLFHSESGEGLTIAFAVDPSSGLIAGFFVAPAERPLRETTVAATPEATVLASPVAAGPVIEDPAAQIAQYQERVATVLAVGEPVVDAVLAGDDEALQALATPDLAELMASISTADVIASYTARQLQMTHAESGASFFGQWNGDEITGVMMQGGVPAQFILAAEDVQDGDLPSGRWTGALVVIGIPLELEFGADEQGNLTAMLSVPQMGIEDASLADVAYLPEAPIGEMTDARAFAPGGRNTSYTADYAWGDFLLRITVGVDVDAGLASAVQVLPAVPTPPLAGEPPTSQVDYRLPFDGTWWMFWGGETELRNYHAATPSQRYAYDILIWKDGATWHGDGQQNEDFWAWGQPVLAPADGTVVHAVNDSEDLPPNDPAAMQAQASNPGGNHVVIQTAEGEYVFIAHMQQGAVRVQEGDDVRAGDIIGLVGNSGNTSEPHIHIHAQDSTEITDFGATGIPLRFGSVVVDGESQVEVMPNQGSFIANP